LFNGNSSLPPKSSENRKKQFQNSSTAVLESILPTCFPILAVKLEFISHGKDCTFYVISKLKCKICIKNEFGITIFCIFLTFILGHNFAPLPNVQFNSEKTTLQTSNILVDVV
jgi:hypothetical protein